MTIFSQRLWYIATTVALSIFAYCIVIFGREFGYIRGYIGDIIIIPLLYFFVRIFIQKRSTLLLWSILGLGIIVEGLQYLDILGFFGISTTSFLGILLGSTFDPWDILAYLVGGILTVYYEKVISHFYKN